MKTILVGVFAHPDDEAFCVGGTLLKEVEEGAELHLICATAGDVGQNPDADQNLAEVRRHEWQMAGKALGATGLHALDYGDGQLSNVIYGDMRDKIEAIVRQITAPHDAAMLKFMTFEPGGVTGHLDHIAVSLITTHLFYKLKQNPPKNVTVKELAYFCFSHKQQPQPNPDYFVFMPAGQPSQAINRSVDVTKYLRHKRKIMQLHHSQRGDAALPVYTDGTENFCVIT